MFVLWFFFLGGALKLYFGRQASLFEDRFKKKIKYNTALPPHFSKTSATRNYLFFKWPYQHNLDTMKLLHWKSHWKFLWNWKSHRKILLITYIYKRKLFQLSNFATNSDFVCFISHHSVQGIWNPPFLFLFHPLYQTTLFTKTNPPFCRSCFSKINMMQIYTTPLNTTIFLTSKSYRGIKLVWIWKISKWLNYLST